MAKRRVNERSLHSAIVDWLRLALMPPAIFNHAPGEGKRGWVGQRDLMSMGYKPGWPDLEFIHLGHVFFAEIKALDGKLTPVQIACHDDLRAAGCPVSVVRSLEEMQNFLVSYRLPVRAGMHL